MPPAFAIPLRALSRRGFLRLLMALSWALPARALLADPADPAERRLSVRALGPYLDTLLPEDSTPSATQLGTDRALIEGARTSAESARLVVLGCAWLDGQARERGAEEFAALDAAGREAVVALAEQSPARSLPRAFLAYTQRQAFLHYYAQPATWEGLGFAGPPQPSGFMDFAEPPKVVAP